MTAAQPTEPSGAARLFSNRGLAALIFPLIIEQLLVISLGFADVLMVASLGEDAVAAVSLGDSINVLVISLFAALATGGAVVCAHYVGAKNKEMASLTAKQLIYSATAISVFLSLAGLVFQRQLLQAVFGAVEADVMETTRIYFFYALLSYPPVALYSAAAALFRAEGNSSIAMAASLVVNILHIGGNALCLFVLRLGVEGVAISTLVSRAAAAFMLITLLCRGYARRGAVMIEIHHLWRITLDFSIIKKILAIGVPNGIESCVFQLGKILVLTLMASFGTAAVAANSAAGKLCEISCIPGSAMGIAMLTVVGQALGSKRPGEAIYFTRKLMIISYIALAAASIPLIIWTKEAAALFRLREDTASLAVILFRLHGLFGMLIWPTSFILPAALRAANDARFTMFVSIATMWIVRVGLSYVFERNFGFGVLSIWYAMIVDWAVRSALFIIRWRRRSWQRHYEKLAA